MLNLLAHEMIHVQQKAIETLVEDKNEREWQAYYENLFHKQFPQIPELSDFHKKHLQVKHWTIITEWKLVRNCRKNMLNKK
ncbi:hypothetical protein [Flavobacterium piscinae]|uniref:hypothetical protein n=1 Tax=Flavobacterium piscinae TaxID=2506424 RepID=UPI002AAA7A32|nr:hypothetical protein [Flavobacterium piscinae]